MKASEITQDGHYWARSSADDEWHISLVEDGLFYYGCGSDEFAELDEVAYEVVGPLQGPAPSSDSFPLGGMAGAVVQSAEKHGDIVRITFEDGRKLKIESDYFTGISLSGVPASPRPE